jgi:hypothetical protein
MRPPANSVRGMWGVNGVNLLPFAGRNSLWVLQSTGSADRWKIAQKNGFWCKLNSFYANVLQ